MTTYALRAGGLTVHTKERGIEMKPAKLFEKDAPGILTREYKGHEIRYHDISKGGRIFCQVFKNNTFVTQVKSMQSAKYLIDKGYTA